MSEQIRLIVLILRYQFTVSAWRTSILSVLTLARAVLIAALAFSSGNLIAGAADEVLDVGAMVVFGLALVAMPAATAAAEAMAAVMQSRVTRQATLELVAVGTNPGAAHDAAEAGDLNEIFRGLRDWTGLYGVQALWQMLGMRAAAVGAAAVVALWHWWLALALAGSWVFMGRRFHQWSSTIFGGRAGEGEEGLRRAEYLRQTSLAPDAVADASVFGYAKWVVNQYTQVWHDVMAGTWARRRAELAHILAGGLLVLAANLLAYVRSGAAIRLPVGESYDSRREDQSLTSDARLSGDSVERVIMRAALIEGKVRKLSERPYARGKGVS